MLYSGPVVFILQPKNNTAEVLNQRLSIITIGTDSLPAMRNFYIEKFGWKPVAENKDIVFFKLNGFLFGLYPAKNWRILQALTPCEAASAHLH